MRIKLVKQNLGDEVSYKYMPMNFCCEKLKKNHLINLVVDEYNDDVNYIFDPQLCITDHDTWTEWGEDFEQDNYYPIKFCPFCGEKIETEIVKEEDISDECERLERERQILWKGSQVTDSKSKETDLRRKVQELDDKIAYYNELREYEKEI